MNRIWSHEYSTEGFPYVSGNIGRRREDGPLISLTVLRYIERVGQKVWRQGGPYLTLSRSFKCSALKDLVK